MKALTETQKVKFLTLLSLGNSVKSSCEKTGLSRRNLYYWRKEDPEFADAWTDALESATEDLEDELRKRALDKSDPKTHIYLIFLLKKLNPEYKENYRPETKKAVTRHKEFEFDQKEIDSAISILEAAKSSALKED